MSKKITDNIVELMQKERDQRSMELFGKPESVLLVSETQTLDKYITDCINPVWKPIIVEGIATNYKVSNVGQVMNIITNRVLVATLTEFGYLRVGIRVGDNMKTLKAHRLVAQAFIPNPDNKREVNHISCIKTCNWVGNLEWATSQENKAHAHAHGLYDNRAYGQEKKNVKYTDEQIHQVCKYLEAGKQPKEISQLMNIPVACPMSIKYNGRWPKIASQYNIPKPYDIPSHKPNTPGFSAKITEEQAHQVCKLISEGKSNTEIANMLGYISAGSVSTIRCHTAWEYVSKEYVFPDLNDLRSPIAKHRHEVIDLLQSGEKDFGKIIETVGVPDTRQARKYIAIVKFNLKK